MDSYEYEQVLDRRQFPTHSVKSGNRPGVSTESNLRTGLLVTIDPDAKPGTDARLMEHQGQANREITVAKGYRPAGKPTRFQFRAVW